jgi:hypothetical protein
MRLNVILPIQLLNAQQKVYYASGPTFNASIDLIPQHDYTETTKFHMLNDRTVACSNFLQPSRWEAYEYGSLVGTFVLYLVLLVLCMIFGKFQPLSSRGVSPHLSVGFLFAQLILEIRNYFPIPEFQGSLCFYYSFGYYPLQQICFLVILIYFLRYFSIIERK